MRLTFLVLALPVLLLGCSKDTVKPKPVNQKVVLKALKTTAKNTRKNNHPLAWAQLQQGEAFLKSKQISKATDAFKKAQVRYQNVYGKYSVRMAEFDTTVGDYAYRAKAWALANTYYLKALRAHQAMAVVLPSKVQQDVDHLHAVYVKTKQPRSLIYGYRSALQNLQTINRQSREQITRLQDSYLSAVH